MKAAFITGINQLEISGVPEPAVPDSGVLVKMKSAAVCGTDIKMIANGHRDLSLPRVPGHEGTGVVVESFNKDFHSGDVVAVYPGIFCGNCGNCLDGQTARCSSIGIFGFNRDGLFREFVPFTEEEAKSLVRISPNADNDYFSIAEPLACCISAYKKIPVKNGTALIIGAGSIGSIFAALLAAHRWRRIVIADRDIKRLESKIPEFVEIIESEASSLDDALVKNGHDYGFDLVVPCCPEGLNWPFWRYMNPGGAAILFSGNSGNVSQRAVDINEVHYRELVLAGSYGCNMEDFKDAVGMIERDQIDLSFLSPCRSSLDELPECIEKMKPDNIKKIIIDRF